MTYAAGHPVRLIGGRLALDFLNTADWTADGQVAHEKIETLADIAVWLQQAGLPDAIRPETASAVHRSRRELRGMIVDGDDCGPLFAAIGRANPGVDPRKRPLSELVAVSALAILSDVREMGRLKMCPGHDCGWLFVDETRNARRKWCTMETCGNRAKAARHYQRTVRDTRSLA